MNSNILLKFKPISKKKSNKLNLNKVSQNEQGKVNSKPGMLVKKRTITIPPNYRINSRNSLKSQNSFNPDTDVKLAKFLGKRVLNKLLNTANTPIIKEEMEMLEFHVDAYAGMHIVTIQDEIRFSDEKTIEKFELKIPENSSFSTFWNIIMTLVLAFYIIMFPMES
jgi:hypothetical protein